MTQNTVEEMPAATISRRRALGALIAAALGSGVLSGESAGASEKWTDYYSEAADFRLKYPQSWRIKERLRTNLMWPNQGLGFASHDLPSTFIEDLPDLSAYPSDGVFVDLVYYNEVDPEIPRLGANDPENYVKWRASEFDGFDRWDVAFSGSKRSYIVRIWIGVESGDQMKGLLREAISRFQPD